MFIKYQDKDKEGKVTKTHWGGLVAKSAWFVVSGIYEAAIRRQKGYTMGSAGDLGTIYRGTGWGKEAVGILESDGTVYKGTGWGKKAIGKVDDDGTVYLGIGWSKKTIGKVDDDGTVYRGTGWSKEAIGEVDDDGTVYCGTGWGKKAIAEVDSLRIRASGAAYLLLFY